MFEQVYAATIGDFEKSYSSMPIDDTSSSYDIVSSSTSSSSSTSALPHAKIGTNISIGSPIARNMTIPYVFSGVSIDERVNDQEELSKFCACGCGMLAHNSHHECSVCNRKMMSWCVTKLGGGEGFGSTAVCPSCTDKSKLSTVASDDDDIANPTKSLNPLVSTTDELVDDMNESENEVIELEDGDVREEAQSSIDMKVAMLTIISSATYTGTIVCNGIEQSFTYDKAPSPDGRGAKTNMFHSSFSLRVPLLYWYRCYGGMATKFNAVPGNCMTECGNFLVCIFETRCSNPRYDPVFYFAASKQCLIVRDSQWVKKYKLAPNAALTVDLKEVQKYCYCYCYLLFLIILIVILYT